MSLSLAVQQHDSAYQEVRCGSKLHYKLIGDMIEVKCSHIGCTRGNSVVYHRFSLDGELKETIRVQDPGRKFR